MVYVQGEWAGNGLRFATSEEAEASARNLMARWFLVDDIRVDESDDEVNYAWDNGLKEVVNAV
jgi:hypothetical protein